MVNIFLSMLSSDDDNSSQINRDWENMKQIDPRPSKRWISASRGKRCRHMHQWDFSRTL